MSTFDTIGFFVFKNSNREDYTLDEKEHQEQYLELMHMYQKYYGILEPKKIVLRGSKITCQYGNRIVQLDCIEDYGVYRGTSPVMTTLNCKEENIHNFGTCFCPEKNYSGRLPYTVGVRNGEKVETAVGNIFAHICVPLISDKNVWHQVSQEVLIEANAQGYNAALLNDAVLVCLYGGIIRIREAVDDTKNKDEYLKWIPDTIMQLNGSTPEEIYLKDNIDTINTNIQNDSKTTENQKKSRHWDQNKINLVWEECKSFYDDYEVQVDPRLLIAIIAQEGSGSFNTSSTNLAADGQNGAQDDIAIDLANAIDLLGGKIIAYSYFKDDFSAARKNAFDKGMAGLSGDAKLDYDDILHYLNWETPRLKLMTVGFDVGVYAGDNAWHKSVREIYSYLAYSDAPKDYTAYAISLGKEKFVDIAKERGITTKPVEFKAIRNGMDSKGDNNNQYSIVGVIK